MTHFDEIKTEISSILEEYKQRFPTIEKDKENKKAPNIISANAIYSTPNDIKSDMVYEMHEAMNKYIEKYGNDDEPEIIKHINDCGESFQVFLSESL